jgi:molybdate transport system substrate-binding protein
MHRLAGFFFALAILFGPAVLPTSAQDKSLTVFAAASMKNALDDIDTAYTAKTGVKIVASYAASSALAKQIEQGAPADIFVSADTDWIEYAINKKTVNAPTRVNLLGNRMVLIAPKDSKIDNVIIGQGFDLAKLVGDGKIATADVTSVLARGEAALGIVYSTDARVEPGVKIVGTFPMDSHAPIIYPVAATSTAKPEAASYLAFLRSSAAKAIFEKYGFSFLVSPTT